MRARREASGAPQLYMLSVEDARAADLASIQAAGGTPEPVAEVVDRDIDGPGGPLPIRIFRPVLGEPLPVLVYFFGGGWTLGTIDTADAVCRTLANAAGCLVVAAGYRLAPEHKFPAAVHDCHAVTAWVAANAAELGADPARIAVGGDSAGGNLAASVTLLAREHGPDLVGQLLVYPNTDYRSSTRSLREGTDPYLFNATSVTWYWDHYLTSPADGGDPLASPLLAADHIGLPPALVITAEYDPLRDQAEQYARTLSDSGVPVTLTRYDGMIHGFFCMAGDLADGRRAQEEAAAHLRTWFTT
ncbi:alpha/beta hydrolase [Catellatospora sp. TT07R-123]|uniref:alpha/beta hydrolase n=1 Tax=Catellatospora sp. TT07R-123 TaxID=2733863 RepID=UPI001BB3CF88